MLSIVIPVYNEEESLRALYDELMAVANEHELSLDVVLVDDGSKDKSWEKICELAEEDSRIRGLRFRRNFGKAAALSAGFEAARGEVVMTLDADLQDDPKGIPDFMRKMESEGLDVVSGWKKIRHDPWHKVYPSRVFNGLVSWMTGVHLHDHNCGMKCYRREIFREVRLYGELHRFVPVLAAARGFKVGELVIAHRARKFGSSKYGFERFAKGFLDLITVRMLTGFGQRPQHFLGAIGLVFILLGMAGMGFLAASWIVSRLFESIANVNLHERPLLIYSLGSLLFGGQLISIGGLAELLIAYTARDSDTYSISEHTPPPSHSHAQEFKTHNAESSPHERSA